MENLTILVVDDNHINRLYFKTILTQWHHHVTAVDSGVKALSICQRQKFDLILMDIRMQPMDGITAAEKIKQLTHHNETPIVAVSAEQIDCIPHPQFTQSLVKPITKPVLKALINSCLTKVRKTEQQHSHFNEKQALAISHQDAAIVQKLRALFIEKLPQEVEKIEHLHRAELWQDLDGQLHYLQGSAQVCAATIISRHIKNYRQHLANESFHELESCLMKLKEAAADILDSSHKNAS